MSVDGRVRLVALGGSAMLAGSFLHSLLGLPNVSAVTIRVRILESVDNVRTFFRWCFVLHMHQRRSKGVPDSAIYTHLQESGHTFKDSDLVILDKEEHWFERGVREAIYERVEKPSLNKPGGLRFNLTHIWDRALRDIQSRLHTKSQTLATPN